MNILRVAIEDGSCDVVALCDVDSDELEVSADEVDGLTGKFPNMYRDYREMLEKEEIEIAIISTPDHWHALQSIACVEAGAHVFVEKPTGHTIGESRAMVEAARAANRVVQVGMHRRIGPHHVSGMKFLKEGGAGDIGMIRAFAHGGGGVDRGDRQVPARGLVVEGLHAELGREIADEYVQQLPVRQMRGRLRWTSPLPNRC